MTFISENGYNSPDFPYEPKLSRVHILSMARYQVTGIAAPRHDKGYYFGVLSIYAQINGFDKLSWDLAGLRDAHLEAAKEGREAGPLWEECTETTKAFTRKYFLSESGNIKKEYLSDEEDSLGDKSLKHGIDVKEIEDYLEYFTFEDREASEDEVREFFKAHKSRKVNIEYKWFGWTGKQREKIYPRGASVYTMLTPEDKGVVVKADYCLTVLRTNGIAAKAQYGLNVNMDKYIYYIQGDTVLVVTKKVSPDSAAQLKGYYLHKREMYKLSFLPKDDPTPQETKSIGAFVNNIL